MTTDEGVIKFELVQPRFHPLYFPPEIQQKMTELNEWRHKLFQLDIVGCDLSRYGACYGNVSMRYLVPNSTDFSFEKAPGQRSFLITGTQTANIENITQQQYVRIFRYDLQKNRVYAEGPIKPSSEAMTHGAIYDLPLSLGIKYVFHAHSPHLWKKAKELNLPTTSEKVHYGTPQMAQEVQRLHRETNLEQVRILAMGGHEDGIISFGRTAQDAGLVMLEALAKAV